MIVQQVAAGQDQARPMEPRLGPGGRGGDDPAQADARDADPLGIDLRPRGQQVDRSPDVFARLGHGADEQLGVVGQGLGPLGRAAVAVVGQLERDGRNAPRRQHRADQVGQRLVAVEDVQADDRRILRSVGTNRLGQVVVGGDGVVLHQRRDHRRRIRQPVDAKGRAVGQQPDAIVERRVVVGLRDGDGFRRLLLSCEPTRQSTARPPD